MVKKTVRVTAEVTVDRDGIGFGQDAWYSHEEITRHSSEELRNPDRVAAQQYMAWVREQLGD